MRVALIIERMDPARGGRETATAQIAAGLAERGCEVDVIAQDGRQGEGYRLEAMGRKGLGRADRISRFVRHAQNHLRENSYDISHAMLPLPGASVYQPRGGTLHAQADAERRRRGALLGWLSVLGRSLDPARRLLGRLERTVAADNATWIVPGSEMVAEEFRRHYDRRENLRVIFNAADVPEIPPETRDQFRLSHRLKLEVPLEEPLFFVAAKNFRLKAVDRTILAFAKYRRRAGCGHLLILGREDVEGYRELAAMQGIGGCVHFRPATSDIFPWYSAADVCVLLSWYDACSRVVLEATQVGIPSITTVFNGAAEALARGAGIVVAGPRDTDAVAAAMAELGDPQKRARRVEACRAAAPQLRMQRHVDELLSLYEEVLER